MKKDWEKPELEDLSIKETATNVTPTKQEDKAVYTAMRGFLSGGDIIG